MRRGLIAFAGAVSTASALLLAVPAQADPDTDFTNALHIHGIYGQKDYNAWIAKIACKRLRKGVDKNAFDSAEFVLDQLKKDSTTEQAWQFLGLGIPIYCPDLMHVLHAAAGQPAPPPPADVTDPALPAERSY